MDTLSSLSTVTDGEFFKISIAVPPEAAICAFALIIFLSNLYRKLL
jgi:hypothetical protein